jgi:hypothetical protein
MATFTTVRQFFRQHTDIPWYTESVAYRQHVDATYHATGKLVSSTSELDEDQLVMTRTVVWNSEESRNEFTADPIVQDEFALRTAHYTQYDIVFKIVSAG